MSTSAIGGNSAAAQVPDRREQLRQTAQQLEGVFVEQLFKAMRETVPDGGLTNGGSGEEMFTSLLDQKMSAVVPTRWDHGLAESLMRQLSGRTSESTTMATQGTGAPDPASAIRSLDAPVSSVAPQPPILDLDTLADASSPEPS